MIRGSVQGNIGNVTLTVSGSLGALPCRLREDRAHAASGGGKATFVRNRYGCVIPGYFRNVGQRRTELVSCVRRAAPDSGCAGLGVGSGAGHARGGVAMKRSSAVRW